jgi:Protein of unknown function (DUF1554)
MNGISGADGLCNTEFGNGWKALLVGGGRRATITPFAGDGQLDWVLQKYRHYYNADDQLIWRTDNVPLLTVRAGQHQNAVNKAFDESSGFYPWSGYDVGWTTFPDVGARGGTCNGWTSNDSSGLATFTVADFSGGAFELCGTRSFVLCVEQ